MLKRWILCLCLVVLGTQEVFGANIYVDASATGTNNGTSWTNAYTSLQSALPGNSGDVIYVAQGVYKTSTTGDVTAYFTFGSGVTVYGGYNTAMLGLSYPLIRNPQVFQTILTADLNGDDAGIGDLYENPLALEDENSYTRSENGRKVVYLTGAANVVLDGLVFHGGKANPTSDSGGVWIQESTNVTITNCTFKEIWGGRGAALFITGNAVSTGSTATIQDCLFTKNSAHEYHGPCRVQCASVVTFRNCSFIENSQSDSGCSALSVGDPGPANVSVYNCLFARNSSVSNGQGIPVLHRGYDYCSAANPNRMSLYNCVIRDNKMNVWGAGFTIFGSGGDEIERMVSVAKNCLITGNALEENIDAIGKGGAGIHLFRNLTAAIENCTVVNNQGLTGTKGNGIYTRKGTATLGPALTLKNSILWGNTGADCHIETSTVYSISMSYCDIDNSDGDPNNYLTGTGVKTLDPQFVAGDAKYHEASVSPCIDAGDPASAYANEPRWLNGCRINMGAYGNTSEAATTATCVALTADITGDCKVTTADLLQLRAQWLKTCP